MTHTYRIDAPAAGQRQHMLVAIFVATILMPPQTVAAMLSDLRCEDQTDPLGVQSAQPRLSWVFAGGGGLQRAYQILVASSEEKLAAGDADLWDSGKVISDQTARIPYQGKVLTSRQHCYWKIRAWDAFYQPTYMCQNQCHRL